MSQLKSMSAPILSEVGKEQLGGELPYLVHGSRAVFETLELIYPSFLHLKVVNEPIRMFPLLSNILALTPNEIHREAFWVGDSETPTAPRSITNGLN